jgi:hypothetical protein
LLKHNYINAGVSGYGLGQMLQLFNDLVKKFKFKYIFIQLSPWLADRAIDLNGPFYGYRPYPYFSDDGSSFKLNPPSYSTLKYTNKIWYNSKPSYSDRMHFLFSDGIKTEICDYLFYQFAKLKSNLGILPKPTKRKDDLERYFFDYTIDVCKKNNIIPIILKISYPWYPPDHCNYLLNYLKTKAKIIDLDLVIAQKANETGIKYDRLFFINVIYRNHIITYDIHPNEFANRLFSVKIFNELKSK